MLLSDQIQTRIPDEALSQAIEAVLFAAGYPVPIEKLAEALMRGQSETSEIAREFCAKFNGSGRGICAIIVGEAVQLCTRPEYGDVIKTALGIRTSGKLSASSMEVLAVVAYNQPTTKTYVEKVRGVDCTYAFNNLLEKSLIEQKGRLDVPGRPILYGTTPDFLRCFGVEDLGQLPTSGLPKPDGAVPTQQIIVDAAVSEAK